MNNNYAFPPYGAYGQPGGQYWPPYTINTTSPMQGLEFVHYSNAAPLQLATPQAPRPALHPIDQNTPDAPQVTAGTRRGPTAAWSANELFNLIQVAIAIKFYAAPHGTWAARDQELVAEARKLGIKGSAPVLKKTLGHLLASHEGLAAPPEIVNTILESSKRDTFGARLDVLLHDKEENEGKTDAERAKAKKKADEDKKGGNAIRKASLLRSRRASPSQEASGDDDSDVEVSAPLRLWTPPASASATTDSEVDYALDAYDTSLISTDSDPADASIDLAPTPALDLDIAGPASSPLADVTSAAATPRSPLHSIPRDNASDNTSESSSHGKTKSAKVDKKTSKKRKAKDGLPRQGEQGAGEISGRHVGADEGR
ncbi:hypothetical protein GGX14DRAFT_386730 [Mycena pura]|uniref:Uncharacterized protein n=1 Tax=Mycena pura TaxID=153505 RepID=A0AAD7E3V2_9AGAR|nr:hypothetical protein GGX14DRAFT_386730 [Mycena pura]